MLLAARGRRSLAMQASIVDPSEGRNAICFPNPIRHTKADDMKTYTSANSETRVGRSVAPEDLRCGDFVSILSEIAEYPSFLWNEDSQLLAPNEPVRIQWRPDDGGMPLKVKAICLPFVFAKAPTGHQRLLDVRQCRLVRLSTDYARSVWKAFKRQRKSRKK